MTRYEEIAVITDELLHQAGILLHRDQMKTRDHGLRFIVAEDEKPGITGRNRRVIRGRDEILFAITGFYFERHKGCRSQ